MPVIRLTAADILKGELIDKGWYGLLIKGVSDWTASKDGKSVNVTVTFVVDGTSGKEIDYVINQKGLGFHTALFSAIAGTKLKPEDIEVDTSTWAGKKLDGKVIQEEYNGRLSNKISDFLPPGAGKNQPVF